MTAKLSAKNFKLKAFRLSNAARRCYVENEDVVGAVPTGDAPTTSGWSAILLPTKVWLILEVWQFDSN